MMLTGGFLTGAALWSILVETRGRFRMVDTLARTGEQQALFTPADPEPLERPGDLFPFTALDRAPATDPHGFTMPAAPPIPSLRIPAHAVPITAHPVVPAQYPPPAHVPAHIAARAEAEQANAAAMLDASSRLLSSFSGVLKSFGQLPAQVATLAVALALFVGATVLSLH
jgi:hypothetical protein